MNSCGKSAYCHPHDRRVTAKPVSSTRWHVFSVFKLQFWLGYPALITLAPDPCSRCVWIFAQITHHHGLRDSPSLVLTPTGFVNGRWQFSTPTESTPLNQSTPKKFGTGDYVGGPNGCAKFGANPSMGGFMGKWVKYNEISFYICLFFVNSPTGQTRRRMFTLDGSDDAQGCTFWGVSLILLPILGGEIFPKPPILGALIGFFKPSWRNNENFILSKLLHRFQPNFAQR